MASYKRIVTSEKLDPGRLPHWASQYAIATQWMMQQGILEQIGQRLRIARQGGYTGLDAFLFLGGTFSAG